MTIISAKFALLLMTVALSTSVYSQLPDAIDVTDQTIKLGAMKEEEIYIGFAEGDKAIFNFSEVNGKEVKEVEIIEYPSNSRFSDFKTNKIENKILLINKQAVYVIRVKNSSLSGRICKINIQRIPATPSTRNFKTSVAWVNKQDTSWNAYTKEVLIGYDTIYEQKSKRVLVSAEQQEELILDKMQRVHSTTNSNSNRTSVFFTLPANIETATSSKKVVAWAYWVGVGEEANESWKKNSKDIQSLVKTGASYFTTPLGALAVGLVSNLIIPSIGEDVYYSVADRQNRDLFLTKQPYKLFDEGKGTAGYKKFTGPDLCQGTWFICLLNDNIMQGIDAAVKVIAIIETKAYEDKVYTDTIVRPKYEKQLQKEPVVRTTRLPVTGF